MTRAPGGKDQHGPRDYRQTRRSFVHKETESVVGSHFAAAITAAKNALASLVGSAPNAKITIAGYRDTCTSAVPGSASSRIKIEAIEVW